MSGLLVLILTTASLIFTMVGIMIMANKLAEKLYEKFFCKPNDVHRFNKTFAIEILILILFGYLLSSITKEQTYYILKQNGELVKHVEISLLGHKIAEGDKVLKYKKENNY